MRAGGVKGTESRIRLVCSLATDYLLMTGKGFLLLLDLGDSVVYVVGVMIDCYA